MYKLLLYLDKLNPLILLLTLLAIIAYTWVTWGMKKLMIKQKELSMRPFIILAYVEDHYILKNVGHGPALKIKMDDINISVVGKLRFGYTFEVVDILISNEEKPLIIFINDTKPCDSFELGAITPRSAERSFDFKIRYLNLENKAYSTSGKLGKDGVTQQKPDQAV
jgi:hypothetical protein